MMPAQLAAPRTVLLVAVLWSALALAPSYGDEHLAVAGELLRDAGVKGGIIVHGFTLEQLRVQVEAAMEPVYQRDAEALAN